MSQTSLSLFCCNFAVFPFSVSSLIALSVRLCYWSLFLSVLFWRSFPCVSSCLLTSSFCSRLALVTVWVHLAQSIFCLRAVSQLTELSTTSSPCLVRMFPLTNFIFLVFWENWISSVSLQPNKRARAKCWLPTSLELYKFCFCFIWISLHVCIF